ncbi:unnamed protein product [Closterium sp. NIES-64]|nr:unnamed protein product [Closterium sp. NIES-64]
MECASLLCVLLCEALFTAGGASRASFGAPLPPSNGGSAAVPSAAQAKPLVWKGKTIMKYVAKLTPTKSNGNVVGDTGASGKVVI